MINRVVLNETSYFGRGSRKKLGEELKTRGLSKVLLVTDFTLMEANVTKKVIDVLENAWYWISPSTLSSLKSCDNKES